MQRSIKRLVAVALLGVALAVGLVGGSENHARHAPAYVAEDPGGGGGTGG